MWLYHVVMIHAVNDSRFLKHLLWFNHSNRFPDSNG